MVVVVVVEVVVVVVGQTVVGQLFAGNEPSGLLGPFPAKLWPTTVK